MREQYHSLTPEQTALFWSRVNKSGPIPPHIPELGNCWEWTGGGDPESYGSFSAGGRTIPTHRAAYLITHGWMIAGMWILHKCDNRRCVRPDHLFQGTRTDNVADMVAKERGGRKPKPVTLGRGINIRMTETHREKLHEGAAKDEKSLSTWLLDLADKRIAEQVK